MASSNGLARSGTSTVDLDEIKPNSRLFHTTAFTKLGTCMPPTQDYGSALAVSRFVAAYGLKGGNLRVIMTKGTATAMLNGHSNSIIDIAAAPETHAAGQSLFATLSAEGTCRVWEVSNQDAGGEIDARDTLNLKIKSGGAQRVFFHPGWVIGGGRNNIIFIAHDGTVTGVPFSREVREEHAVDPSTGLIIDKFASVRLTRDSRVLDLAFHQLSSAAWRCATAHEDGTVSVWALSNPSNKFDMDDDGSSVSVESSSIASGHAAPKRNSKSSRQASLTDIPPMVTIKIGSHPVTAVGFATASALFVATERNCELSMWSLGDQSKLNPTMTQRVVLTRSSNALKSLRCSFARRIVDGATCVVLCDSRTPDGLLLPISIEKKGMSGFLSGIVHFKLPHPVLSLNAEYDIEKDKLVCHLVDTENILDAEMIGDVAFGSQAPQDVRNSIRRASKRAESLIASPDDAPQEWSDRPGCCVIS